MDKKIKVKDHPNLVRDPKNNAIVSTDRSGYEKYMAEREARLFRDKRIEELEARLAHLESLLLEKTNYK